MPAAPQIWRFDLDAYADADAMLLDDNERARAAAFVFARDRHRYVAGRCALRRMLGQRLNLEPHKIALQATAHGKPLLNRSAPAIMNFMQGAALHFNLSHSHEICYLTMSEDHEVGIDVELDRAIGDPVALGRTVFSPSEMQQLLDAPPLARNAAFLRGWTRKESLVKAIGIGIGIDLQTITVGLDARDVTVAPIPGVSAQAWQVRCLATPAGEYAAIAVPALN